MSSFIAHISLSFLFLSFSSFSVSLLSSFLYVLHQIKIFLTLNFYPLHMVCVCDLTSLISGSSNKKCAKSSLGLLQIVQLTSSARFIHCGALSQAMVWGPLRAPPPIPATLQYILHMHSWMHIKPLACIFLFAFLLLSTKSLSYLIKLI